MPFLDNISKKVEDAAKTAAKKSGEIVEVTKLNRSISVDEEKISKLYAEIGKVFYLNYKNGDDSTGDDLTELCDQISGLNKEIENFKDKILELKKIRVCPNCKTEVGPDIFFCPKCGTKLETNQPEDM